MNGELDTPSESENRQKSPNIGKRSLYRQQSLSIGDPPPQSFF
jgi:hypothetical protein